MNELQQIPMEFELKLRVWQHQVAITSAHLIEEYKKSQAGEVSIPQFITDQQASEYAMQKIHEYQANGTLQEEYIKAYDSIKDRLPDNYSTLL